MTITLIAGVRPNFVKVAPIMAELRKHADAKAILVHTGQHYDFLLSQTFFQDLAIPEPDYYLEVGSGSHGAQTARMLERIEEVLFKERPDLVMVFGDANSTLAGALAAAKLHIPVAHVEAGLRSFNPKMPEELNRRLTDHCSELLFTTEKSGVENLRREGVAGEKIHFVGNVMIDSLLKHFERLGIPSLLKERQDLSAGDYAVLTLHRPENVDDPAVLGPMLKVLAELARRIPIVWPLHPRTREQLKGFGFEPVIGTITITEPLRYLEMLALMKHARFVLTDSGGIQEETTMLGVPCLTLRTETERPVTVEKGTNIVVGIDPERIREHGERLLTSRSAQRGARSPELWDGKAAERIVKVISERFNITPA